MDTTEKTVDFTISGIIESGMVDVITSPEELEEGVMGIMEGEMAIYIGCIKGHVKIYLSEDNFYRIEGHPNYMNGELLSVKEMRETILSLVKDVIVSEDDSKLFQIYITEGSKENNLHSNQIDSLKENDMQTEEQKNEAIAKIAREAAEAAVKNAFNDDGTLKQPEATATVQASANDDKPMSIWTKVAIGVSTVAAVGAGGYAIYRKVVGVAA